MSIVVNTHSQHEESKLLDFLDSMKYDYINDNDQILSMAQQEEVIKRDDEFENGNAESFSLDEIINYFNLKDK